MMTNMMGQQQQSPQSGSGLYGFGAPVVQDPTMVQLAQPDQNSAVMQQQQAQAQQLAAAMQPQGGTGGGSGGGSSAGGSSTSQALGDVLKVAIPIAMMFL